LAIKGIHGGKELDLEQAAYHVPELGLRAQSAADLAKQSPTSLDHLIDGEGEQPEQG
jgi:hypothetical protein